MVPKDENLRIFQRHAFPSKRGCWQHGEVKGRRNKEEDEDGAKGWGGGEGKKEERRKEAGRKEIIFENSPARSESESWPPRRTKGDSNPSPPPHSASFSPVSPETISAYDCPSFSSPSPPFPAELSDQGCASCVRARTFQPPPKKPPGCVGKSRVDHDGVDDQARAMVLVKISRFAMAAEAKKLAG